MLDKTLILKYYYILKILLQFINLKQEFVLKTHPKHCLDYLIWPLLKLFWEPFSKKESHFWHWRKYNTPISKIRGTLIPADFNAHSRRGGILRLLWETNFGWQKIAILEPANYEGLYQIVYSAQEISSLNQLCIYQEKCSLMLRGKVAVQIGPQDTYFYMISFPEGYLLEQKLPVLIKKEKLRDIILI
ncbi:hypothetical protein ISR92_02400 [Patescibacteria group bacterium]|nr:hypothetical protein [Patescibacteria group bacterium]